MNHPLYHGWVSPLGANRWRLVARHADYRACWGLTLAEPVRGDVDRLVRRGEKHPNDRKRPR